MGEKKVPTGDYECGYARTPVHTRFKKGQSGHPGGRRTGSRNYKTILREVGELMVPCKGQSGSVDMVKALLLSAAKDALEGNHKSRVDLLDRFERHFNEPGEAEAELPEEDQAMLDAALKRRQPDDGGEGA